MGRRVLVTLACAAIFAACSDSGGSDVGSTAADAAADPGARDATTTADATSADATTTDAGSADATSADATSADAGSADATSADAAGDAGQTGADAGTTDTGTTTWPRPACGMVQGTNGVTFTFDEGLTLARTGTLTGTRYTYGLAALRTPGLILAVHADQLLRSTDSGCNWTVVGPLTGGFPVALVAAGADRAYAWSDNNRELYRIDGTTITPLTSPVTAIHGIAVDRRDPDHLRIAGDDGQIWESTTAGNGRFTRLGVEAFPGSGLVYRVAFDPRNLDRAFAGAAGLGARWTDNAGVTWTPVRGLSEDGNVRYNVFSIAPSPASGDVVWFQGINLRESLDNVPGEGRHVFLSSDGGRSARPVLTQTSSITLINGSLLAPHPTRPSVLYFVFGTYFGGYGTDLFRYDSTSRALTVRHNRHDDVNAIDFAPGDPDVMFLGLTSEDIR